MVALVNQPKPFLTDVRGFIFSSSDGSVSGRAVLFIVGISIVVGAVISLLATSETISEKKSDDPVRKSDDQSRRV